MERITVCNYRFISLIILEWLLLILEHKLHEQGVPQETKGLGFLAISD